MMPAPTGDLMFIYKKKEESKVDKKIRRCLADVKCRLYEAGVFQENEVVLMQVGEYVLMEREKGERISYRAVNVWDYYSEHLFCRKKRLKKEEYHKAVDKIKKISHSVVNNQREDWFNNSQRAERLLVHIFDVILPRYGMGLRQNQKELSVMILKALQQKKLALCEAEVGTGKTHAYILALTIHNLFAEEQMPSIISTSTIALQKALTEEYIPQISCMLMEYKMIDRPLSFVVRKGKKHYVCNYRLKRYERAIEANSGDELLLKNLSLLEDIGDKKMDLDNAELTPYVKDRISVLHCMEACPYGSDCRYMNFKKRCLSESYDIQITNHNFFMADIIGKRQGRKSLFPEYGAIVFDEAHKLLDTARQMYCVSWTETEMSMMLKYLTIGVDNVYRNRLLLLFCNLEKCNSRFFERLGAEMPTRLGRGTVREKVMIGVVECLFLKKMINSLEKLLVCLKEEKLDRNKRLQKECQRMLDKLTVYLNTCCYIFWIESEQGRLTLYGIPKELEKVLYQDIWSRHIPMVLTSGTMSIEGDLSYIKQVTGLQHAYQSRLLETSKKSPFDYEKQGLLYIPENMPFPNIRDAKYMSVVVQEILQIIKVCHGHTMILFTSYWLMERVYYCLQDKIFEYPLYLMGKGKIDVISNFRKSENGVLFASDSAGEGIDLAGDILSSLIIVKLPFPVPDPVMECQKEQYENVEVYKREVIIPQMLIKMRQWIGRGIRRENDTVAFSILDNRAASGGKYRNAILHALPRMPVTDRLSDVSEFILEKKDAGYFERGSKEFVQEQQI